MSCFARRTLQETVGFVLVSTVISDADPVTRREYIPIGSTATSMSPTVTGAPMPILTTHFAICT